MEKNEEGIKITEDLVGDCILGSLSGTALSLLLLYLITVLIANGRVEQRFSEALIIGAGLLGAALSGGITAKRQGRGAVQMGLAGGCLFLVLFLILGAVSSGGFEPSAMTAKLTASAAAGGLLGGAATTGGKARRRAKRGK